MYQHEELGGKISQVRFSRQRPCAEERDQLPNAKWGTSSSPGKKVLWAIMRQKLSDLLLWSCGTGAPSGV